MDLASILTNGNNLYTNFYNSEKNSFLMASNKNGSPIEQNTDAAKNIILVKKGSTGYMTDVDIDDDGEITLQELNKYCEENGVSEKDKIKMLTAIEMSKVKEKLIEKNVNETEYNQENQKSQEAKNSKEDKSVYAKKGEDKYNEAIDSNKDGIITYIEYVSYCTENSENHSKTSSKEKNIYLNKKTSEDNEVISTVEYVL